MEAMTHSDPASVNLMFQLLACHLRATRHIKSNTIDQYLAHMGTLLSMHNWIFAPHIRSPNLARMLKGWCREDILRHPKRLSCHIPATCQVMQQFFIVNARENKSNPRILAEIAASAGLQYFCAFRANEASPKAAQQAIAAAARVSAAHDDVNDEELEVTHHLQAGHCSFRFLHDAQYYLACQGTIFPADKYPDSFHILQDTHKTSMARGTSHRSVFPNPALNKQPFCVLDLLWQYVTCFPPPASGAFFPDIVSGHTTHIMKITARSLTLDDTRMSTRAIRSGSVSMLRNMNNKLIEQQQLQEIRDHGNWSSAVGEQVYAHDTPDARRLLVVPSLYDCGFMTVDYLRWYYMTPAV
jgi:hypothetical protein